MRRLLFIQLNTVLFFLPFHHNLFFVNDKCIPPSFPFYWLLCTFLGIFSSLESFLLTTRLWIFLASSLPGPEANYLPNFRLGLNISNSHLILNNEAPIWISIPHVGNCFVLLKAKIRELGEGSTTPCRQQQLLWTPFSLWYNEKLWQNYVSKPTPAIRGPNSLKLYPQVVQTK